MCPCVHTVQLYKSCRLSDRISCLCKWGQNLLLCRVVLWMKCGKCKALYPVTVQLPPDRYQVSSPCTQATRTTDRSWFTAQLSPWLRVLPGASLLPSCLSSPRLFLLAPTGLCPGRRAVPGCPSQARPTSHSDRQDTGIPILQGPASCRKASRPGWKGCSVTLGSALPRPPVPLLCSSNGRHLPSTLL